MSESEFVIDTSIVTFKDQDDKVLAKGILLDIHYTIAEMAREASKDKTTNEVLYTEVAKVLREKFQPNGEKVDLSWAIAMKIAIQVQKKVGDEKKT